MIKACIFDMDGTLVNTINSISYFGNNALKNVSLPPIEVEKYKYMVGNGAKILVERMLQEANADSSLFEKVFNDYSASYDNDFLYLTEPYDGIIDLLKALKKRNIKTTVLSNKPHVTAKKVSDALFGDSLIDICMGAMDGISLKPDPSGAFEIMKKLNLGKDECIYVGDTATDMKTGKSAELFTVGVLWGFREKNELLENGADKIISHPSELLTIIDKLN